jgi:predicted CXXCH cytochrome family protein
MSLPSSGVLLLAFALGPFSHKVHAPLKLECTTCHATAQTGERADFPESAVCASCHASLAGRREQVVPERSVYPLAEFVHFSHAKHAAANLACQTCHGQIWNMEEVRQVLPMTMKACITCHRAMNASTRCSKCHQLAGQ